MSKKKLGLSTKMVVSASTQSYTTEDEDVIYVDESSNPVKITLSSPDAEAGNEIEVVNMTGTNTVTVDTEGSETIHPDAEASKVVTKAGWSVGFVSDGINWTAGVTGELESLTTDALTFGSHEIGAILEAESAAKRTEWGSHMFATNIGGASDDGWDTWNSNTESITYSTAFSNSPDATLLGLTNAANRSTQFYVKNESTTGFELEARHYGSLGTGSKPHTHWLSIGDD